MFFFFTESWFGNLKAKITAKVRNFMVEKPKLGFLKVAYKGLMRLKLVPIAKKLSSEALEVILKGLKRLVLIAVTHLDLANDVILLYTIVKVLGETWLNPFLFSSQVAWILLASIAIPLLISAIIIAFSRLQDISTP